MPISLPRTRSQEISASRRPWSVLFSRPSSYSLPSSSDEFSSRIRQNLKHFQVNYVEIVLSALLVRYIWYPIPVTITFIFLVGFLCMYLFRKHQLVLLNRLVDDKVVLSTLVILTDVALVLTGAWLNVLVSSIVGVGMVVLHAAFRKSDDRFLDEEEAAEAGLVSVVRSNGERSPPATVSQS